MSNIGYGCWRHGKTGEVYALADAEGIILAAWGPLNQSAVSDGNATPTLAEDIILNNPEAEENAEWAAQQEWRGMTDDN